METQQTFRVDVIPHQAKHTANGRSAHNSYIQAAHQLGYKQLTDCHAARLYFLQGNITAVDVQRIATELLTDPVTETFHINDLHTQMAHSSLTIDVTLLPGVTDPPAANLLRAARLLGIDGLQRVATGQRFLLQGDLDAQTQHALAVEIFANPVIQRFTLNEAITPPFFAYQEADDTVDIIPVCNATDDDLLMISKERRLSLDLAEMQAVRAYFRTEGHDPTDVELEMLAQTWSEHCVHKTFKALIEYTNPAGEVETIDGLLNTYIRAATDQIKKPWVYSAFVDNAGIIAFDDRFDLAFKAETHNHPSALEPFGGANTGVGGVVRDVIGVSARPIANTNVLCFGPPDMAHDDLPTGVLHPARIADGVISGIEDYGNKMGIPTVNGSIHYHPGYTANPLVFCGCLGILPHNTHPTEVQPGDLIVAIGGRTGRDGLRGATFSSMEMDVQTSELAGTAVQIGNPIMEKQVQEVVLQAREAGLYNAITDCGAGGFSSAVGEMGEKTGARVQLQDISLKYPGLRPWEIWLSEAQERMVLAVPPQNLPQLQMICTGQDVEATILGTFAPTGRMEIFYGTQKVGDLDMDFLHDGLPRRQLKAVWQPLNREPLPVNHESPTGKRLQTANEALLALLAHPDTRSKEDVIRKYDHEVQGGTAVKPLTGHANYGPSDATVLVPQDSQFTIHRSSTAVHKGAALANGICPAYTDIDPYNMAYAAIDEALRNVIAVGADPDQVSILDNFCWGNPTLPDRLGSLVRCAQGCYDAALAYQTPFISGKDSLNNEYTGADGAKHAIPGTLLISALGIVPDVMKTTSMDLKQAGNFLIAIGETGAELGGSHYGMVGGETRPQHQHAPKPVPQALDHFRALHQAIQTGIIQACHDCAEGGIATALAEMCIAGGLGVEVKLMAIPRDPYWAYAADDAILFSESLSRFLVEVRPDDMPQLDALLADVPHNCIGVIGGTTLRISSAAGTAVIDLPLNALEKAWRGHLDEEEKEKSREDHALRAAPHASHLTPHALLSTPRVLILHANGTNRDHDAALAVQMAGGDPQIVHLNQLLAGERRLSDYGMLIIPGGFSYGDDLGAGVLWSIDLQYRLHEQIRDFAENGRPILGICNGFQVLVKAGLLPGFMRSTNTDLQSRSVTLTYNQSGHFECRWIYLQPNPDSRSLFTQDLDEPIYCPVAHGEGRLLVKDEMTLASLQTQNLIPLQYAASSKSSTTFTSPSAVPYPANPNGSILNIAALCNSDGNVLGLMPHPENHIFPWQHPRYHRGERGMSGLPLFVNGIKNI